MRRRKREEKLVPRDNLLYALEHMKDVTNEQLIWMDKRLSYSYASIFWKGYQSREKQILEKVKEIFYPRPEIKFAIRSGEMLPDMIEFIKGYRGRIIVMYSRGIILRKTNTTICKIQNNTYGCCRGFLSVGSFDVVIQIMQESVVLRILDFNHVVASIAIKLAEAPVLITNPDYLTLNFLRLEKVEQQIFEEELKYCEAKEKEEKQLSLLVHEKIKLFVIVLLGLGGDGIWPDFLKRGLYDPRILLFVASFLLEPYRPLKYEI